MAQLFWLSGQTLVDGTGTPYALAKAYFYETGTTTAKATYSNAGLSSANANPVVADSDGRFGLIYLVAGRYKVVLTDANDVQIGDDLDPVDGVLALISAASAPSSPYAFMRYHNTSDGNVYRRSSDNASWINEGPVDGLGSAASVTQQLAGTATDAFSTPDSVAGLWQRGSDIASASTLSLPAAGGGVFNVTGTTGVTGISSALGGRCIKLRFAGALTLTHNGTSFILPGAANITTVAGDTAEFINEGAADAAGSNWRCFNYERSSGSSLNNTDFIATQANQEAGSSTTALVTSGRQHFHPSAAKAWVTFDGSGTPAISSSYNVTSITDNGVGNYTINFTNALGAATYAVCGWCQAVTAGTGAFVCADGGDTKSTSALQIRTRRSDTGAAIDSTVITVIVFGDMP